jgi:hypothetical protein
MSFSIHLTEEALQEEIEAFLFYEDEQTGLGERFLKKLKTFYRKFLNIQLTIPFQTKQKRSATSV